MEKQEGEEQDTEQESTEQESTEQENARQENAQQKNTQDQKTKGQEDQEREVRDEGAQEDEERSGGVQWPPAEPKTPQGSAMRSKLRGDLSLRQVSSDPSKIRPSDLGIDRLNMIGDYAERLYEPAEGIEAATSEQFRQWRDAWTKAHDNSRTSLGFWAYVGVAALFKESFGKKKPALSDI